MRPTSTGREQTFELTEAEQAAKRRAVALYRSEKRNLGYVDCTREVFRPLAPCDYSRPPHAGQLWWARFQWVPFRHPMVDFTPPAEVYATIGNYLGRTP